MGRVVLAPMPVSLYLFYKQAAFVVRTERNMLQSRKSFRHAHVQLYAKLDGAFVSIEGFFIVKVDNVDSDGSV
jgi:hypothetical protein